MNQSFGNLGIVTATFSSCTFSGNSASQSSVGASIRNLEGNGGEAHATVANSIFEAPPGQANFNNSPTASLTSEGYNLSNDAAGGDGATGPGGFLNATGDIRNTDPLLGPLQNNGGPTPTHALLPGSPAIDKGKSFGVTTDQRGKPRPFDNPTISPAPGGNNSDIGAYEVRAVFQGGPSLRSTKWRITTMAFAAPRTALCAKPSWSRIGNPAITRSISRRS